MHKGFKPIFRRGATLLLALMLTVQAVPVVPARAASSDLKTTVEKQIRTFAKSINRTNADDDAASALAKHGLSGRGKKLSVGQNHALTATLMNSEMGLMTMIQGCSEAIKVMQQRGMETVFDDGGCYWGSGTKYYSNGIYSNDSTEIEERLWSSGVIDFSGKANAYDASLVWMAGSMEIHQYLTRKAVTKDTVTYDVTVVFEDRFDFATATGSFFKDLMGIFGTILFKEFDWAATAKYSVTVPLTCDHSFSDYHWRYDAGRKEMVSVTESGWEQNRAKKFSFVAKNGKTQHYYELDRAAILQHDAPWKLEYTVKNPGTFALSPTKTLQNIYPYLVMDRGIHLFYQTYEFVNETNKHHCYGYTLANLMNFSANQTYRIQMENVIAGGKNMIYMSVYNCDLQQTVLGPLPMDDYYWNLKGVLQLQNSESDYLSGKDLKISYIGNDSYPLNADYFELKVWENGENGAGESLCTTNVTKPTCSAKGYTTHTCAHCGYSYKDTYVAATAHDYKTSVTTPTCTAQGYTTYRCKVCAHTYQDSYTDATGHDFGPWTNTKAPGCATAGEEVRSCATCKQSEIREISATGHRYNPVMTPPSCTEQGYTTYTCACGDNYEDNHTAALGHDYGIWVRIEDPDCGKSGVKERTCDRCAYAQTQRISGSGHLFKGNSTRTQTTRHGSMKIEVCEKDDVIRFTPVLPVLR